MWALCTRSAQPVCPVHHPKQLTNRKDEKWNADKRSSAKEQPSPTDRHSRSRRCKCSRARSLAEARRAFLIEKLVSLMKNPP